MDNGPYTLVLRQGRLEHLVSMYVQHLEMNPRPEL